MTEIEKLKKRLELFENYTNFLEYINNDNGPSHWICKICDNGVHAPWKDGKLLDAPDISAVHHDLDCPYHPDNL